MSKKVKRIIIVYIFLFFLTFGALYNINEEGAFLGTIISILSETVICMIIPAISSAFNRFELFSYKNGRRICIINSLIVLAVSILYMMITNSEFLLVGGIAILLFYVINMAVFVEDYGANLNKNQEDDTSSTRAKIKCNYCGKYNNSKRKYCYMCGKELNMDKTEEIIEVVNNPKITNVENNEIIEKSKIFCTKCGNIINKEWDFCKYCGSKIDK